MKIFSYSEACQNLSHLLDLATKEGEVRIIKKDSRIYRLIPAEKKSSPLDVKGIRTKASTLDIIRAVRESRKG